MANHKSAIKRIAQAEKHRQHNQIFRTRARTFVKNARIAVAGKDQTSAAEVVRLAIQDLDKASSRGVIHPRNAARRKSRLMKQLHAMTSAS